VGAIALAAIAGIAALPALLGGEKPPPMPPDVGLIRPAAAPPTAAVPPPAPVPKPSPVEEPPRQPARRLAGKPSHEPRRSGRHRRRHHQRSPDPPAPPVPSSSSAPPVYSYVPPPHNGEFRIER
jgi:hypothetical protein